MKLKSIFLMLFTFAVAVSCSEDKNETANEITEAEVITVFEADQLAGVADTVLTDISFDSATGKHTQKSTACYTGVEGANGYTITFDDCEGPEGKLLNGSITVLDTSKGNLFSFTATYTDFSVGDISISGTRSFDMNFDLESSSYGFDTTSNMDITLEDGATYHIEGSKDIGLALDESSLPTGEFTIDGSWTVVTGGNTYNVTVIETVGGSYSCTYLTSGIIDMSKNGLKVSVDFGNGDCDDVAMMTYPNGTTEQITLHD